MLEIPHRGNVRDISRFIRSAGNKPETINASICRDTGNSPRSSEKSLQDWRSAIDLFDNTILETGRSQTDPSYVRWWD
jgi:hypothetical protein